MFYLVKAKFLQDKRRCFEFNEILTVLYQYNKI